MVYRGVKINDFEVGNNFFSKVREGVLNSLIMCLDQGLRT